MRGNGYLGRNYSANISRNIRAAMSDVDLSVGNRLFQVPHVLMMAARTVGGLVDPGTIGEMERDLAKVIEDFDRAMNVEALRSTKKTGEHLALVLNCFA